MRPTVSNWYIWCRGLNLNSKNSDLTWCHSMHAGSTAKRRTGRKSCIIWWVLYRCTFTPNQVLRPKNPNKHQHVLEFVMSVKCTTKGPLCSQQRWQNLYVLTPTVCCQLWLRWVVVRTVSSIRFMLQMFEITARSVEADVHHGSCIHKDTQHWFRASWTDFDVHKFMLNRFATPGGDWL